ncbi:peptidoglycan editing factor PgeF [Alicycliphilus denitrificans]|uniref:peptidoglycan editing factor PgeF n=1 Tax=Alicycliphilus denitrificans TaxID=179636 RepID=UPI00384DDF13
MRAEAVAHTVPHDWLRPDWPAPAHVHALCTTRNGGVSAPPYDSFNLGRLVGDDPAAVQANWAALQAAVSAAGRPVRPVYLCQVHGTTVQPLDAGTPEGGAADACTTATPGVACTVMAADCLPVLLTNRAGTRVAAAHAGWRGLAAGVLEETLKSFMAQCPMGKAQAAIKNAVAEAPQEVLAWLGPCIGPQAFEVGAEVRAAFCDHDPQASAYFKPQGNAGKWLADLAGLARQRLRAQGVTALYGNDGSPAWCTVGNPSRFFSHRRDSSLLGASGRMAACIWIGA